MSSYISVNLRQRVRKYFQDCCAYCLSPQSLIPVTFEIDHIKPKALGGETVFENLCFACPSCNSYKQDHYVVVDPETGESTFLFHPHQDIWKDHFSWANNQTQMVAKSAKARATITQLQLNRPALAELRELWVTFGRFPPQH